MGSSPWETMKPRSRRFQEYGAEIKRFFVVVVVRSKGINHDIVGKQCKSKHTTT